MKRVIAALLSALLVFSALALAEEVMPTPEAQATEAPAETADAVDTESAEPTEAPSETEQPQWILTICYLFEDRTSAQPQQLLALTEGEAYDVEPPELEGYVPDPARVKGVMPGADITIEVIYRVDDTATQEPADATDAPEEAVVPEATDEPEEAVVPEATDAPEETVVPEATDAPEETDEPEATVEPEQSGEPDAGEGWTLTIRYVLFSGEPAADDCVLTGLTTGQAYEVASPEIEGLTADQPIVSGVMGASDETVTVIYGMEDGFMKGGIGGKGGGGISGNMSRGKSAGDGMAELEDAGFQVTPGEAFTSIHSSGDMDDSLYVALAQTDASAQSLNLSLESAGEEQSFSAEWTDDALILKGEAGRWSVGGDALRALDAAGMETLVLISGDFAVALPTDGFASGYTYDCLRAQGLSSDSFEYAIDVTARQMEMTVQDVTYALAESGGDVQLTGVRFETAAKLNAEYAAEAE